MKDRAAYLREYRRQIADGERVPKRRVHPSPWCREPEHDECHALRSEVAAGRGWGKVKSHPSLRCSEHEECLAYRKAKYAEYNRKRRTPQKRRGTVEGAPHGTREGYRKFRCGCPECREWARLDRQRFATVGQTKPSADASRCLVCGTPVLEHDLLRRCG